MGDHVAKLEVLCLSSNDIEVLDTLGIAESMDFISLEDNYISFKQETLRKIFEGRSREKNSIFYRKLAECIRKITPSNYVRRAFLKRKNGRLVEADTLWCLVIIEKLRSGHFDEALEIANNFSSELRTELKETINIFADSYALGFDGKVTEALEAVSTISNYLPLELLAEKCCLECEYLSKKVSLASKELMLEKLSRWDDLKHSEPGLWYRIMQLKILAASELHLDNIVREVEFEIISFYSKRVAFDTKAIDVLNRLDLYSEQIYSPEIAHRKLMRVERVLSKSIEDDEFDKLIDLYIARVNLSSNCLLLGLYDKAIAYGASAIDLISKLTHVRFPCPELVINNTTLAFFFAGKLKNHQVLGFFWDIINYKNQEDYILIHSNYSGVLLFNNLTEQSLKHLLIVESNTADDRIDSYYFYYLNINLAILEYLNGLKDKALERMQKINSVVEIAYRKNASYYRRHYDILLSMMYKPENYALLELQEQFENIQGQYLDKTWDKFKKVYLFSDLQIWTSF